MKVLLALYYYRPYISGLTVYVERLAEGLARRGHHVTVLTSRYDPALPMEEWSNGVRVIRVPVAFRVSKGVVSPSLGLVATKLLREHDVLSIHLPNVDAPGLTIRAHRRNRPVTLTYHCDINLPPGPFNRLVDQGVFIAHFVAACLADRIIAYTQDYAMHSRLLSRFGHKLAVIPPPVVMPSPTSQSVELFKRQFCNDHAPVIGMAARFASEKGVEYLVAAMSKLRVHFPRVKVLFAGPYEDVLGEDEYRRRLQGPIERLGSHWQFLGPLSQSVLPAFYASCDVVVVPSLNSTEGFSLVQVESMLSGTPVVVSDLPGVRQPVKMTGMGEIVKIGSADALANGILRVLFDRGAYVKPQAFIERLFDVDRVLDAYVSLFEEEVSKRSR